MVYTDTVLEKITTILTKVTIDGSEFSQRQLAITELGLPEKISQLLTPKEVQYLMKNEDTDISAQFNPTDIIIFQKLRQSLPQVGYLTFENGNFLKLATALNNI